jgi:hypothetical protein
MQYLNTHRLARTLLTLAAGATLATTAQATPIYFTFKGGRAPHDLRHQWKWRLSRWRLSRLPTGKRRGSIFFHAGAGQRWQLCPEPKLDSRRCALHAF